MKTNILIAAISVFILTGCTGTQIKITPEPTSLEQKINNSYAAVGTRDIPAEKTLPVAGNLTEAFSNEIRSSGFAKEVYYPFRPNDAVDMALDSKFNVTLDPHSGSMFAKSFFTGFTLFLLEPFLWYDFDYSLSGDVSVIKNGKIIKQVSAKTDATVSTKWLSLSEAPALESEALTKAKKSLFWQLMHKIGQDSSLRSNSPAAEVVDSPRSPASRSASTQQATLKTVGEMAFEAEAAAMKIGCIGDGGGRPASTLMGMAANMERYQISCTKGTVYVLCESGHCAKE